MSNTLDQTAGQAADRSDDATGDSVAAKRIISIVITLFCVEIGLILLLLPWFRPLWDNNFFLTLSPDVTRFMMSYYARGAISGLGLANLWIAAVEARKLLR